MYSCDDRSCTERNAKIQVVSAEDFRLMYQLIGTKYSDTSNRKLEFIRHGNIVINILQ